MDYFTISLSPNPQQCLHESSVAACVYVKTATNCWDANINVMFSALLDPLPQTQDFQLLRNRMYFSSCFYFSFHFGFAESYVPCGKG